MGMLGRLGDVLGVRDDLWEALGGLWAGLGGSWKRLGGVLEWSWRALGQNLGAKARESQIWLAFLPQT